MSSWSSQVAALAPTAWYRLKPGALWDDSSGHGHTLTGTTPPAVANPWPGDADGGGAAFGAGDYGMSGYGSWMDATSAYSLVALGRAPSASGIYSIMDRDNLTTWQFRVANGHLNGIGTASGAVSVTGATALVQGDLHMFAMTWDGATIRLYVDGVLDGSGAYAGAQNKASEFAVGASFAETSNSPDYQRWQSELHEAIYWAGTALTAADMAALYDAATATTIPGTLGLTVPGPQLNLSAGRLLTATLDI